MGDPGSDVAIYTIDPVTGITTPIGTMQDMVNVANIQNVNNILPGGIAFSDGVLTAVAELRRGGGIDVWQFNIDVSGGSFGLLYALNVDGSGDDGNIRGLTYCENGSLMFTRDSLSSDVGVINSIFADTIIFSMHDQIFRDIAIRPDTVVGGEFLPIDSTALILAGAQTNAVWIMSALAVIGSVAFGALYISNRRN